MLCWSCHTDYYDSGRLLVIELTRDNLNFQFGCLYGPNNKIDGAQFFESLYQALDYDIPGNLVPRLFTPPGFLPEQRPWLKLVTWVPQINFSQGGSGGHK